jgi:hypothetical protein
MKKSEIAGWGIYWAGILFVLFCVGTALTGCDGNHIIGEEPTCTELVTNECVPEIVEEFCDDGRFDWTNQYSTGYRAGFTAAQEQDTHECPDVVECDDEDSDRHEHQHGKGHTEHGKGKGKGHTK